MNSLAEVGYKPPSSKMLAKGVFLAALLVGVLLAIPSIASAAMAPPTYTSSFGSKGTGNGQFTSPNSVATDPSGNVWVTDPAQSRVQKFNASGEYLCQRNELHNPKGIAADSKGNVWIVESTTDVQEVGPSCELLTKFGSHGEKAGQFRSPNGIAIDPSGNIWVADEEMERVEKFNSSGTFLTQCGVGDGPISLAADKDGDIWVGGAVGYEIQELNSRCQRVAVLKTSSNTEDIGIDNAGNLWVRHESKLDGYYPEGEQFASIGESGSGAGQFKNPAGIAPGPGGVLWVVDRGNCRVEKWTEGAPARVQTERAAKLGRTEAKLTGRVNPEGEATTYQFEYGTSTSFGLKVPASGVSVGAGSTSVAVSQALDGLPGGTTYYYRLVATTAKGTINGETRRFTTFAPVKTGQMRIEGQTFAEFGITEAPVLFYGSSTLTFQFGASESVTLSCGEEGSGTLTSAGVKSGVATMLSCHVTTKGWEKCEIPSFKHNYGGSEAFGEVGFGKNCPPVFPELPAKVLLPAPSYSYEYGSEAASFNVNVVGTTSWGTHPVTWKSNAHWALSGVKYLGLTLGYW